MSNRTIYDALINAGLTRAGALGVMGNMAAESGMKSNIAQRGTTKLSDEQYTAAADNGLIDFANDQVGYGLCQWTYHTRKNALLTFCKARGASVGDEAAQVDFCIRELRSDFSALYKTLCTSTNINQCSDLVCSKFERPAVENFDTRRAYAHQFAEEITEAAYKPPKENPVQATFPPDPSIWTIQLVMQFNGFWDSPADGHKSKEFFNALREFTNAMESC
jgi:hypothetical protein